MPPDPSPWMHTQPLGGPRQAVAVAVADALRGEGAAPTYLAGPDGSGKSRTAGAVAASLGWPTVSVPSHACRQGDDLLLCLGQALGARPIGDEKAVAERLRDRGRVLVVLDDADHPSLIEVVERLRAGAPAARWLLTGAPRSGGADDHVLQPLPTGSGNPLLDLVSSQLPGADPNDPWSGLDALSPRVTALAFLPGGLPGPLPVPDLLRQPLPGGRVALRRGVAAALRQRRTADPARVAAALVPVLEGLFELAFGGTARPETPPEDAFALRWLGETLSDPDEAARASAASARLLQAWGQPAAAREALAAAERRGARAGPAARALLCWADADILLATGAVGAAGQRQRDASTLLREAGDLELLATHLRRWGDNQYARGAPQAAASFYREARALYRQAGNQSGVAATLRGAGDAAVASGELLTSVDLYEQASSAGASPIEAANRLLGLATLSMARSELGAARRQLDEAERVEEASVLLRANLTRRRADLSLRRGRSEEAIALADQAVAMYCAIGERGAEAAALRLRGDAQATRGQLQQAAQSYSEACALQVRTADVPGLRRTLAHAIALEQSCADSDAAHDLRTLLHELR